MCPFTANSQQTTESVLLIFEDLYHPTSKLLRAICGEISHSDVKLKPDDPEATIFIAELSFCRTSNWTDVAKHLRLCDYEIKNIFCSHETLQEAAFQMMLKWLRSSVEPHTTLQHLTDALGSNGIMVHVHKLVQNVYSSMSHREEHYHQLTRSTVADITMRIASQWKFVGRLLGMTDSNISLAVAQGGSGTQGQYMLMEQTVAMLDQWGKNNGHQATLFKLKNAIYAVHEHSGHELRDAVDFLTRPFQ